MNKKIQAIVASFHPQVGGMETNNLHVYSELAKRNWETEVITLRGPGLTKEQKLKGIKISRFGEFRFGFFPVGVGLNFTGKGVIVIHNFRLNPHLFIAIITIVLRFFGLKKYKLILSAHGYFSADKRILPQGFKFQVMYIMEKMFGFMILSNAVDAVRAVSEKEKLGLLQKGFSEKKITVIGNGLENQAFELQTDHKVNVATKQLVTSLGSYIVQICRIDMGKNIEAIIKAMPHVLKNISLVIAGKALEQSKKYMKSLLILVEKLGLQNRVHFIGEIRGYDKYYVLRNSKAFVQMSYSEGFSNSVFEAMSQKCVCVVSKGSGMEELVTNGYNGYSVDLNDYNSIAEKINYIVDPLNNTEVLQMKEYSFMRTKDRSWKETAKSVEKLYLNLLSA